MKPISRRKFLKRTTAAGDLNNIAGNHLTFWKKLIGLGNDPWKYGNWLTPGMVFEDVVVSGV
jgi:hypothetical protein